MRIVCSLVGHLLYSLNGSIDVITYYLCDTHTHTHTHTFPTDLFSVSDHEELVLNTLATLNNLTYYADPSSFIVQRQTEVAESKYNTELFTTVIIW